MKFAAPVVANPFHQKTHPICLLSAELLHQQWEATWSHGTSAEVLSSQPEKVGIVLDYRLITPVAGNGNLEKVQGRSLPLGLGQVAA